MAPGPLPQIARFIHGLHSAMLAAFNLRNWGTPWQNPGSKCQEPSCLWLLSSSWCTFTGSLASCLILEDHMIISRQCNELYIFWIRSIEHLKCIEKPLAIPNENIRDWRISIRWFRIRINLTSPGLNLTCHKIIYFTSRGVNSQKFRQNTDLKPIR